MKEKEIRFQVYKYVFVRCEREKDLFSDSESMADFGSIQEYFDILLKQGPLFKRLIKNEFVDLENRIDRTVDDVFMMVICNKKTRKLKEWTDEVLEVTHNPGCRVIVDNRDGIAQIAIEKSSSFESDCDVVRDIMEEAINEDLRGKGYRIEINAKIKVKDFWDFVEEECIVRNDTVKSLKFEFPNKKRVGPIDVFEETSEMVVMMNTLSDSLNAAKGELQLFADGESSLSLQRNNRNLAYMVALTACNGYEITVNLNNYGSFTNGDCVKAQFDINETHLDNFKNSQPTFNFGNGRSCWALINWLDDVRRLTESFDDEEKTDRKGKVVRKEKLQDESDLSFDY